MVFIFGKIYNDSIKKGDPMKASELPMSKINKIENKEYVVNSLKSIVFYEIEETSMCYEMGKLAIVEDGLVIYKSNIYYGVYEETVIINNRFIVFNKSNCISMTPYRSILSNHVYDLLKMSFIEINDREIGAGGNIPLKDIEIKTEGNGILIDKIYLDPDSNNWISLEKTII